MALSYTHTAIASSLSFTYLHDSVMIKVHKRSAEVESRRERHNIDEQQWRHRVQENLRVLQDWKS